MGGGVFVLLPSYLCPRGDNEARDSDRQRQNDGVEPGGGTGGGERQGAVSVQGKAGASPA